MRLVLAALTRPLTLIVALIAILAGFFMAVGRMRMDIFPQVGNPVIYVAQPYGGMNPAQMEGFLTYYYEYHFLYITGIESIDSKSIQGAALMKLSFREGTNMEQAMAETVGYVNRARAFMPPGTVPPFITRFDPGSVAVGLLLFSSSTHTQGELQNIALNQVRPLFATLPGVSAPPPFGGNQRTIVVTLDPDKLKQYSVSPEQAISAVSTGTVVAPSGNLYDGSLNRIVRTNATLGPELTDLMATPIHPHSGTNVYLRDIGTIENGTDIVTAYAHVNGKRTVYIPVAKRSDASTLAVIQAVKAAIPSFKKVMPDDVDVQLAFDQSGYVSNAINGLVREALLGAVLTGFVVLLFLRDWRSSVIVVANIPFALAGAVLLLWATGQTINIMTLGGLALAVGILVDEATVEIENIHTQMLPGVSRAKAVLEACRRTVTARLLSMLCVLAVFVPSFFMKGVGRQLFVPLSLAVGFAMISSYFLSSSLVPVFSTWLMKESHRGEETEGALGKLRLRYDRYLERALSWRWQIIVGYLALTAVILLVASPLLGTEIFPNSNGPVLRMRLKAPVGTRIEETEPMVLQALELIRNTVGKDNVEITSDYVGIQPSSYPVNLIHLFTSGPEEALVQVQLRHGHPDDEGVRESLRSAFQKQMPNLKISFEAGDIVSQVMSFGSPTPVQIDVQGVDLDQNYGYLAKVQAELQKLTFLRDVSVVQAQSYPVVDVKVDRDYAGQFGLTMADVTNSLVPATGSSRFIAPNYWRDPKNGNAFQIQVQLPSNRMQGLGALSALPLMRDGQSQPQLDQVASLQYGTMPEMIERLSGQRIVSVTANLHGIALGDAQKKIEAALKGIAAPPKGSTVVVRGQIPALEQTISGLRLGLLLAIAAIFLLLMANFQSLRLPLAILSTIPGVLCGVVLMLLLTRTTLNIQSFMGAVMAVGISVANSILLISFAEQSRYEYHDVETATRAGATGRIRAILMTAAAMICGMIPLAIGFGEGGAQSAPLGRAVVGGLVFSTLTTLLILPIFYALLQRKAAITSNSLNPEDPSSRYYAHS
ncbi:efflux RND transporter permease subunit [Terriglobus saanensis]|uniref:Acriflavin resistance protein n=1 Tax=Terriglobus saanensis (strain ATCC BAA-1853 / DSM 23119 / SP1PR4) TaxID=401053 RepID=E8V1Y1_TERSS|nr:efflux RND transporter permease subunit [Terriglobus saanensis]ADV83469.1 acriflavin resistance protein [Terriglobus saanensis SP1PR4]